MNADKIIINRPERVARRQRTLFGLLTLLVWIGYAYLWLPLITLLLWLLGFRTAHIQLYLKSHDAQPFFLLVIPLIVLAAALLQIGWAEYNRRRFQGRERRNPVADVGLAEVSVDMGATLGLTRQLQEARVAILHMSEDARPLSTNTRQA